MKISLRTFFAVVTIVAILFAIVAWRLRMHSEWSRLEQELTNAGVEFALPQKSDFGLPDLFGINSQHYLDAEIDCNKTVDATRLAELSTLRSVTINRWDSSDDNTLKAKLPLQVSAKYLLVINEVPSEVYGHVASWHTIEEAEICTQTWTVEAAKAFARSPSISVLSCSEDDQVDDTIAAELLQLPKLRELDLSMTFVSDLTVERLAKMPQLTKVDLSGSQVTLRRVKLLREQLPNTNVVFTADSNGNRY